MPRKKPVKKIRKEQDNYVFDIEKDCATIDEIAEHYRYGVDVGGFDVTLSFPALCLLNHFNEKWDLIQKYHGLKNIENPAKVFLELLAHVHYGIEYDKQMTVEVTAFLYNCGLINLKSGGDPLKDFYVTPSPDPNWIKGEIEGVIYFEEDNKSVSKWIEHLLEYIEDCKNNED